MAATLALGLPCRQRDVLWTRTLQPQLQLVDLEEAGARHTCTAHIFAPRPHRWVRRRWLRLHPLPRVRIILIVSVQAAGGGGCSRRAGCGGRFCTASRCSRFTQLMQACQAIELGLHAAVGRNETWCQNAAMPLRC